MKQDSNKRIIAVLAFVLVITSVVGIGLALKLSKAPPALTETQRLDARFDRFAREEGEALGLSSSVIERYIGARGTAMVRIDSRKQSDEALRKRLKVSMPAFARLIK